MEELIQEFTATDEGGIEHRLLVYQNFIRAGTFDDPSAVVAGLTRILTEDGKLVNCVRKGEYEIVETGVHLRSSDPDAP
jgi:hypothetical protein